jgi:hypothetical protein
MAAAKEEAAKIMKEKQAAGKLLYRSRDRTRTNGVSAEARKAAEALAAKK